MHVTGGTLQLEQTELTATQLDTNVARSGKKRKRKLRRFSRQCPSCLQPSQVTKLKGCICCMLGLGMFCSRCQGLHFFPPYFKGASMPAKVVAPRLPNRGASVQLDILGGPADPGNAIGEGEILESQRCFHSSPFFFSPNPSRDCAGSCESAPPSLQQRVFNFDLLSTSPKRVLPI